jgi:predicted enzyme related to lactoylglutathione lyase
MHPEEQMPAKVVKEGVDVGIIVGDAAKSLAFYRDVVGLEHVMTMPMGGGIMMERLAAGNSVIKLVSSPKPIERKNPGGGTMGAIGLRYFTITVADIKALTAEIEDAGYPVVRGVSEIRPGLLMSMVSDPDGNIVEFLQAI